MNNSLKLMFRLEDVVYVVRIHGLTKHGYKYIQAVEYDSLKKAKSAMFINGLGVFLYAF